MILPSKGMQRSVSLSRIRPPKDARSTAGKPCGGLEARLNFAWVSVQDSEKSKTSQESARFPPVSARFTGATARASFGDDHCAINGLPAVAMTGDRM
jgi:hypothetical protein